MAPSPSPAELGIGLCVKNRVSPDPNNEFPESTTAFNGAVNDLMERPPAYSPFHYYVLKTFFDLSNGVVSGNDTSQGDFTNAMPTAECPSFGCTFYPNATPPTPTSFFGSRFRGYLNVTPGMVNKDLHFGFYVDDAVSFIIFDQTNNQYQVILRTPGRFEDTWRSTNTVKFLKGGLYPVEILYAQGSTFAINEMSLFDGPFIDFETPTRDPTAPNLKTSGFVLVSPNQFFQTENGHPAGSPPTTPPSTAYECLQCKRAYANAPGNGGPIESGGCGVNSGYYCNGAALCAPCDTARVCGLSCSPCGLSTPNCVNVNGTYTCVECENDSQCGGRRCDTNTHTCTGCLVDSACPNGQVCDKLNYTCVECNRDEDCPPDEVCAPEIKQCRECNDNSECDRGKTCSDHQCVTCSTNESCAGNSCNCCPDGTQCAASAPGANPACVECVTDSQCTDGKKCDSANGRCVDSIPECNTSERCGTQCVKCPSDRPICLDGQVCVACRNDLECAAGEFCISGECSSCTTDRHCGARCEACDKQAPFCLTTGTTASSSCVQCRNDSDCPGGQCNPATFTCVNSTGCEENCAEQDKVCNGSSCVECFADAHCPCGGSCDTSNGTCTTKCEDSGDCLGVEYCSTATQECERGRRKPGTTPQGGSFCCETTTQDLTSTGTGAFIALLLVGFLFMYSRRAL